MQSELLSFDPYCCECFVITCSDIFAISCLISEYSISNKMEVILASKLMLLLTIIVKTKSQALHQFVHDGHCNGGYNGGCDECTFGRCRDQCAKIPEAGYFAYRAKPRGCSCYSAAEGCPDDDRYPDYNAYRIVREVVKDFKIRVYERRNNDETESIIRFHKFGSLCNCILPIVPNIYILDYFFEP